MLPKGASVADGGLLSDTGRSKNCLTDISVTGLYRRLLYSIFVQCSTHLRERLGLKPEIENLMQNRKTFLKTHVWLV
jgi:hypothetical protein